MTKRTRYYVWLAVGLIIGVVYGRISRDWSFGTVYAVFAGVGSVVCLIGLFWTELAPDGDLRRRPQT